MTDVMQFLTIYGSLLPLSRILIARLVCCRHQILFPMAVTSFVNALKAQNSMFLFVARIQSFKRRFLTPVCLRPQHRFRLKNTGPTQILMGIRVSYFRENDHGESIRWSLSCASMKVSFYLVLPLHENQTDGHCQSQGDPFLRIF